MPESHPMCLSRKPSLIWALSTTELKTGGWIDVVRESHDAVRSPTSSPAMAMHSSRRANRGQRLAAFMDRERVCVYEFV